MNLLAQRIHREILETGPIRFSRFMELALYAPGLGYYEAQTEIGRHGDFYTSVSVGDLFGSLLARQFADWMEQGTSRVQLVETGAHRGQLAADILRWLRERASHLFPRVDYWIIEPSPVRQSWQESTLREFGPTIHWAADLQRFSSPGQGIRGIVFSNELLDAMPVHRLRWNAASQDWEEGLVGLDSTASRFVWLKGALSPDLARFAPCIPAELGAVLPDGFTTEISPAAIEWWRQAAGSLAEGVLLTFDYGLCGDEFLTPERREGTLRAYARHRVSADVLENPGEQDLTAHVNFSAIQQAGEMEGLATSGLVTQRSFLTEIFERVLKRPEDFQPWTPVALRQFQTLTHPEHLGRSFKALIQRRAK